jgi:hypothetical protein
VAGCRGAGRVSKGCCEVETYQLQLNGCELSEVYVRGVSPLRTAATHKVLDTAKSPRILNAPSTGGVRC